MTIHSYKDGSSMIHIANSLLNTDLDAAANAFGIWSKSNPANQKVQYAKIFSVEKYRSEEEQKACSLIKRQWRIWDTALFATHISGVATGVLLTAPLSGGTSLLFSVLWRESILENTQKHLQTYPDLPYCEAYKLSCPLVAAIDYNGARYINQANFGNGREIYNETDEQKRARIAFDREQADAYQANHY